MKAGVDNLTYEQAIYLFTYVKETGEFFCNFTGNKLGYKRLDGYLQIHIKGRSYELGHRLATLMVLKEYPINEVDHKNKDKLDNSWVNLRQVTKTQNQWNSSIRSDNISGVKGVNWVEREQRWVARIQVNKARLCLGYFRTLEEAKQSINNKRMALHGEYASHG